MNLFKLSNYTSICNKSSINKNDGTVVHGKTDIPFNYSINKFIHLEIQLETKNVLNTLKTYRPPASDITNSIDNLNKLFQNYIKNETKCVYLGDIYIL